MSRGGHVTAHHCTNPTGSAGLLPWDGSPTIILIVSTSLSTRRRRPSDRAEAVKTERETPTAPDVLAKRGRYPRRWTRTECRRHQPGYLYTHNKEEGILRGLLIWNPDHMHGRRASRNEDSLTAATPTLSSAPSPLLSAGASVLRTAGTKMSQRPTAVCESDRVLDHLRGIKHGAHMHGAYLQWVCCICSQNDKRASHLHVSSHGTTFPRSGIRLETPALK